jgi:hypothetical protein
MLVVSFLDSSGKQHTDVALPLHSGRLKVGVSGWPLLAGTECMKFPVLRQA